MRQNQIIGIAGDIKSKKISVFSEMYHLLGKEGVFTGYTKTYQPKKEGDDVVPPETKPVQLTVQQAIKKSKDVLVEMFNVIATQDVGNCIAKADVKIGETALLKDVPATHLIFLEKQLKDIETFITKLPTLDPAENWKFNEANGCYESDKSTTYRTKKVPNSMVVAPPTEQHPAQVHIWNDEINIGTYTTTKFSGCMKATEKEALINKVTVLKQAVQIALQEANSTIIEEQSFGKVIVDYIFK